MRRARSQIVPGPRGGSRGEAGGSGLRDSTKSGGSRGSGGGGVENTQGSSGGLGVGGWHTPVGYQVAYDEGFKSDTGSSPVRKPTVLQTGLAAGGARAVSVATSEARSTAATARSGGSTSRSLVRQESARSERTARTTTTPRVGDGGLGGGGEAEFDLAASLLGVEVERTQQEVGRGGSVPAQSRVSDQPRRPLRRLTDTHVNTDGAAGESERATKSVSATGSTLKPSQPSDPRTEDSKRGARQQGPRGRRLRAASAPPRSSGSTASEAGSHASSTPGGDDAVQPVARAARRKGTASEVAREATSEVKWRRQRRGQSARVTRSARAPRTAVDTQPVSFSRRLESQGKVGGSVGGGKGGGARGASTATEPLPRLEYSRQRDEVYAAPVRLGYGSDGELAALEVPTAVRELSWTEHVRLLR